MHSIKKLKKYAIAKEIVEKVAKEDEWGVEGSLRRSTALEDDKERIARDYAGMISRKKESIIGCATSLILGISGGYLGYKLGSNINESIGIPKIGRIGLDVFNGVLGFVGLPALYSLENKLEDMYIERAARKYSSENLGKKATEKDRQLVYGGLMDNEFKRADIMAWRQR